MSINNINSIFGNYEFEISKASEVNDVNEIEDLFPIEGGGKLQ